MVWWGGGVQGAGILCPETTISTELRAWVNKRYVAYSRSFISKTWLNVRNENCLQVIYYFRGIANGTGTTPRWLVAPEVMYT